MDVPQSLAEFSAGRALFWMHHESVLGELTNTNPPAVKLDVNLMPKLVDGDVRSQYPGGPTAIVGVNGKADADRQAAAIAFVDWITTDEANAPVVKASSERAVRQ